MQVMKELGKSADFDLTQGVPFFPPPSNAVEKALQEIDLLHRYGPDGGDPELIQEVSLKLKREDHLDVDPDGELMITSGANLGFVNAAAAVCDPGDDMVLLSPYYFNHFMTLDMLGVGHRICPSDDFFLPDVNKIRSMIGPGTRAVVMVSPNNPTGVTYPREIISQLVDLCRVKNIWLISDETYERFVYDIPHTSPGSIDPDAPVISLFSFSKVFGISGWRVGYMTYPRVLHESLLKVQDTTVICPSRISQRVALHCLRFCPDHIERYLGDLDRSRRMLIEWKAGKEDLSGPDPNGAYYCFLKYKGDRDYNNSMELARDVYKSCGVLLVPGDPFGSSDPPSLRISYGNIDPDNLKEALIQLDVFFV